MWPLLIHHAYAEFAFTIDHRRLGDGRRPRSTLLAANREGRVHGAAGGVCRRMRTKRELEFWMAVREHCVPAAYGTLHLVWGASVAFEYIQ